MKAYITHWAGGNKTIGTQNLGGSTEVDIPQDQYNRLVDKQWEAISLQEELTELYRSKN